MLRGFDGFFVHSRGGSGPPFEDTAGRFTIDGEPEVGGIVSASEVTGGSLAEQQEMVTCVRETLFTAKFDPPEAGGTIVVEYPFAFSTK